MIYQCTACKACFSETNGTPLAGLKRELSFIITVLNALNEGMSMNATCRTFQVGKNSVKRWLLRLGNLKETLFLYALCRQFLQQVIEGDELYTKVGKNTPAAESKGWTIVLMERSSRFIWEMHCGTKDKEFFLHAMNKLLQVIENTSELSLFTDGERRYGNSLFSICQEVIRTGKPGRPPTTLKQGVQVRVKNKGSQAHKRGPKRAKVQAPKKEHPETKRNIENKDVHANHVEAFNAALRRKVSAYRRKTNTYAKGTNPLQVRLDVHWILHNFVRKHFTTKQVPAVMLGVIEKAFSVTELFKMQITSPRT